MNRRWLLIACCAALAGACDDGVLEVEPDPSAPVQTDRLGYTLGRTDHGVEGGLRFVFTNTTADTIYFVKCGAHPGVGLDKLERSGWVDA